jgi:putative polyketide hydroxylase
LELVVRAAAEQSGADIRFSTELVSFSSGADGVSAVVRDLGSGSEYGIEADYLVAADGHRAGVRNKVGIGADGPGVLTKAVYFVFDADLTTALRGRRFLLGYLDQPTPGTALVPLRQHGRWLLGVPYHPEAGESPDDYSGERCIEMARLAVGDPELEVTLVQSMPGVHKVSTSTIGAWVAQQYRSGRIFFVGDAAHVVPPTGSYGANTGIADAHNIAWKLAAVIKRQAGAALLDTYEEERRPVAQKTLETALHLLHDRHEGEGDDVATVDNLAMIFGYRYESPAILTEAPAPEGLLEDPRVPSGRPGFRAPHVWLDRAGVRVSTIDLFGGAFSLLVGTEGADWSPAAKAVADAFGIDLVVHQLGTDLQDLEGQFLDAYGLTASGATLVRPDGFVAWRSPELPFQPARDLGQVFTQLLGVTSSAAGSSVAWS